MMGRPLKVWGRTSPASRPEVHNFVAATSKAECARLLGTSINDLNNFGMHHTDESGYVKGLCYRMAIAQPGVVFSIPGLGARMTNDERYSSIKVADPQPRPYVPMKRETKAERAERQARYEDEARRRSETERAISDSIERIKPLLEQLGINPNTVVLGSGHRWSDAKRLGVLLPAEAMERLVRLAVEAEEMMSP